MPRIGSGRHLTCEAATGQGVRALGTWTNLRADVGTSKFGRPTKCHLAKVNQRKGASAMAKLHARPSNQYRYEHYDPRF